MQPPKFPAGEYSPVTTLPDQSMIQSWTDRLQAVPGQARQAIEGLNARQLDTRYRNWTIRQIIHHLADSHINCYVRFKWSLTEETPAIKSYDESQWSDVVDARTLSPECSIQILEGIHSRWSQLLRQFDDSQWQRGFFHPELDRVVTLVEALPSYVWHADHHLAQIRWVRDQHGW